MFYCTCVCVRCVCMKYADVHFAFCLSRTCPNATCLSVCPSVCLSVCLCPPGFSVCPSVCLSVLAARCTPCLLHLPTWLASTPDTCSAERLSRAQSDFPSSTLALWVVALIRHPGVEAQPHVMCNKTKPVTMLLKIMSITIFVCAQDRVNHNLCFFAHRL